MEEVEVEEVEVAVVEAVEVRCHHSTSTPARHPCYLVRSPASTDREEARGHLGPVGPVEAR